MKYFYYINIVSMRKNEKEIPDLKALFYVIAANTFAFAAIFEASFIFLGYKLIATTCSIMIIGAIGIILTILHIQYYYKNREKLLKNIKIEHRDRIQ